MECSGQCSGSPIIREANPPAVISTSPNAHQRSKYNRYSHPSPPVEKQGNRPAPAPPPLPLDSSEGSSWIKAGSLLLHSLFPLLETSFWFQLWIPFLEWHQIIGTLERETTVAGQKETRPRSSTAQGNWLRKETRHSYSGSLNMA